MAKMLTDQVSSITYQQLMDGGINPFSLDLLVESYASLKAAATKEDLKPVKFVWRGVWVELSVAQYNEDGTFK